MKRLRAFFKNLRLLFDFTPLREYGEYMTVTGPALEQMLSDQEQTDKMVRYNVRIMAANAWHRHRRILVGSTVQVIVKRPGASGTGAIDTISTFAWKFQAERHGRLWRDPGGYGLGRLMQEFSTVAVTIPLKKKVTNAKQ